MKLAIDELTFQRYSGAAENAYLSVLDNLKDVVAVLRSLDSIDVDGVQARLQQLETSSDTRATEEKSALEERLALLRSQTERAQLRLSKNEVVMTKMEQISARAAEWQTDVQFAATDVEAAITELVRLADFAHELT
jgi:predicted nucleotidyltransferase